MIGLLIGLIVVMTIFFMALHLAKGGGMRIFVAGASGVIGVRLLPLLVAAGPRSPG